jgi:hypothetical protein
VRPVRDDRNADTMINRPSTASPSTNSSTPNVVGDDMETPHKQPVLADSIPPLAGRGGL